MKPFLFSLIAIALCCQPASAQRRCGFDLVKANTIAHNPYWAQKLDAQKASLQGIADRYRQRHNNIAAKTTAASAIPVIFHFVITEAQYNQIGGTAGIQQRVDSQIAVLNRDFNAQNYDSVLIPLGWKPLFAASGIHFGLAHTTPSGYGTPGYDIKIIPATPGGFYGASSNYSSIKHEGTGGTDGWDATKYLNIWCGEYLDIPGLLGLTAFKSLVPGGLPLNEVGICLKYVAVGKRVSRSDYYIATGFSTDYYDKGRTLTHEMGHFFEIWHTWGDDGGFCPWDGSGSDDGLADTPPEGNNKYYAYSYDVPNGTYRDSCHKDTFGVEKQPYGVASLDFMNYTDDTAMQLFTPDQVAVMAHQVSDSGENYTLTQHPELLDWSLLTYVHEVAAGKSLSISPNPAAGITYLTYDQSADELKEVTVINTLGQEIKNIHTAGNKGYYSIDLAGFTTGIYFVRCTFASGSITRKILIQ